MKIDLAIKLLKGLGFTDELLKKADEADFDADAAIEAVNNSQKEHYETLLKNELTSSITEDVTKQRDGELLNKLNYNLKKSGVPLKEIETLPMHEKIIFAEKFFKEKYGKSTDADELKKQYQELEAKNLELTNKITETEETWKGEVEKVKKESQNLLIRDKVDLRMQKEFNNIPDNRLIGGKKTEGFYLAAKNMIDQKFDTSMDDKGNVVFMDKGTQKRVTIKKDGKEDFANISDILQNELKQLSLLVESNGQGKRETVTTTTEKERDLTKPTASRLEQLKAAVGA